MATKIEKELKKQKKLEEERQKVALEEKRQKDAMEHFKRIIKFQMTSKNKYPY
jgi:hypothetical protein